MAFNTGRSSSSWSFKAPSSRGWYEPDAEWSARMKMQMAVLAQREREHRSFWDQITSGAGSVLGKALNIISRPHWAATSFVEKAGGGDKDFNLGDFLKTENWQAAKEGLAGRRKMGFGELLDKEGYLKGHSFLRGAAGLGLDIAADPLMALGLASVPAKAAGTAAKLGARLPRVGRVEIETGKITADIARPMREAAEAVHQETWSLARAGKLVPEAAGPIREAADMQRQILRAIEKGEDVNPSHINRLEKAMTAVSEASKLDTRLALTLFGSKTARLPLPIRTPRVGKRVVGRVPGAKAMAKGFKPGWEHRVLYGMVLTGAHQKQRAMGRLAHELDAEVLPAAKRLNPESREEALAVAETHGMVDPVTRKLNEPALRKAQLTDDQIEFVRAWHGFAEKLRRNEHSAGFKYDTELDYVYVPTPMPKAKVRPSRHDRANEIHKSDPRFTKSRRGSGTSRVAMIRELKTASDEASELLESDPIQILRQRAMESAARINDKELADMLPAAFPGGATTEILGKNVEIDSALKPIWERYRKAVGNAGEYGDLERMANSVMRGWRVTVTQVNPGYHVRNTVGDIWNMYLDGVPAAAIPVYITRSLTVMGRAALGNKKARSLMDEAESYGALAAYVREEPFLQISGKGAYNMWKRALQKRENLGRFAHYLYRREVQRLAPHKAAEHVRRAHFDYSELTEFEMRVMRKFLPFYTWTRKNVPYQIQKLFMAPGRVSALPKAVEELEYGVGGGEGDILPPWAEEGGFIKTPFGYIDISNTIPLMDIQRWTQDFKGALGGSLGPQYKLPIEALTGHSLYTGRPIVDPAHPRNPAPEWLGSIPFIREVPGLDVGQTERGGAKGLGWSPWADWIFGQTPITAAAGRGTSTIRNLQRGGSGDASWLSSWTDPRGSMFRWWSGFGFQEFDKQHQQLIAQLEWRDEFERLVRGARDEDLLPESEVRPDSQYQRMVNEALRGAIMRGGG